MRRARTRLSAAVLAAMLGAAVLVAGGGAAHALSNPAIPQLTFDHVITSHPFSGAPGNAIDIEGLGYVAATTRCGSPTTTATASGRSTRRRARTRPSCGAAPTSNPSNTDFLDGDAVGTGLTCAQALDPASHRGHGGDECLSRTDDFESVIYDSTADVLYVTSGNCCTGNLPPGYPYHPTVWKLTRNGSDHFVPTQWQALPEGEDPTAGRMAAGDRHLLRPQQEGPDLQLCVEHAR